MDVVRHNRLAWDRNVSLANQWTIPVDAEQIQRARDGHMDLLLTPSRPVPDVWLGNVAEKRVLCLAGSGGQQAPLLAAAGALVTVLDNSPAQLKQDQFVAQREGLELQLDLGDMADLSRYEEGTFDLIFHPCSNCFVPNVLPVWQHAARTLRSGGTMVAGFANPVRYLMDDERKENGQLVVRYAIPYSDLEQQHQPHIQEFVESGEPLEFGHSLEDQIGGQLRAGLQLLDLYEDRIEDTERDPLSNFIDSFIATRAIKAS